jgi:hypothetical protein
MSEHTTASELRPGDVLRYGTIERLNRWTYEGTTWVRVYLVGGGMRVHNAATKVKVHGHA